MLILLTENKILYEISKLITQEIRIPRSLNEIETQDNSIILTDNIQYIPLIKKGLPKENKNVIIFVEGINTHSIEYKNQKLEFLSRIINQIKKYEEITSAIEYLPLRENTLQDKFTIEGNIKNLPEEALDIIVSFVEYFSLQEKLDITNIIISTSEIIDNIIEATMFLNKSSTKMDIEFTLKDNSLGITIRDYLGVAEIYSIAKSLEKVKEGKIIKGITNEIIEEIDPRGRGYTLIMKTSGYVITKIVGNNCFRKYNQLAPHTETTVIYFFNDREMIEERKLGVVIEFL